MSPTRTPQLSPEQKERLVQEARLRRKQQDLNAESSLASRNAAAGLKDFPTAWYRFEEHPAYQQMQLLHAGASHYGLQNPYFKLHEGVAGATTVIGDTTYINFSSYNYLGLCGHPQVNTAAIEAIARYGTSVSASRLVSGERPVHRALERALADLYQVDDALCFVSGHATNVTVIGHLLGPRDLVLHDELIHNSSLQGMLLSGARRLGFPHNDWQALDQILCEQRRRYERVLVVVEGLYSMDGDFPDLPNFIEVRNRHKIWLMVDEAHSFGVMGTNGHGIRDHFGIHGDEVDIWMGTLSKALAACGGYIAGNSALIENLRYLAPGFLYSVGMPPPVAAAAHAALDLLKAEPARVARLRSNSARFLALARAAGLDTGTSAGLSVVPIMTGSSSSAVRASAAMFERGVNVQPILYPAVPEQAARLRFFISCEHIAGQLEQTVAALGEIIPR